MGGRTNGNSKRERERTLADERKWYRMKSYYYYYYDYDMVIWFVEIEYCGFVNIHANCLRKNIIPLRCKQNAYVAKMDSNCINVLMNAGDKRFVSL